MLQAYKIEDKAVGVELPSWGNLSLNENKPFLFSDTLQAGYKDITSIENIVSFGSSTNKDFKYIRDQAKYYVRQLGLNNSTIFSDPSLLTPLENEAFLVGTNAVGEWLGKEGQIAIWQNQDWLYLDGSEGENPVIEYGFNFIPTQEEKTIAASWLIGSVTQQIYAFGGDQQAKIEAQEQYAMLAEEVRELRHG